MRVFEMFRAVGKSEIVSDLNIEATALYLLARPSTSVETQRQIIDQATKADTTVTIADVKEARRTETQPQPPKPQTKPKPAPKATPAPTPEAADPHDQATATRIAARCAVGTIGTALKDLVGFVTENGCTEGRTKKFLHDLLLTEPSYNAGDVFELIKWLKQLHSAWKAHDHFEEFNELAAEWAAENAQTPTPKPDEEGGP
jgi:hypothetical protein